MPKSRSS